MYYQIEDVVGGYPESYDDPDEAYERYLHLRDHGFHVRLYQVSKVLMRDSQIPGIS